MHVVTLIKDLNGNHVIQKCLNKLVPEDNQVRYWQCAVARRARTLRLRKVLTRSS